MKILTFHSVQTMSMYLCAPLFTGHVACRCKLTVRQRQDTPTRIKSSFHWPCQPYCQQKDVGAFSQ